MPKTPHPAFRMPRPMKITGRTSAITNAFVNGIIPVCVPSKEEVQRALEVLEIDEDHVTCAYCGDPATEWDHLQPIVSDKRPTGFISEIANLVPACGKCNQSKSGSPWRAWMLGAAPLSPATRGISDLNQRVERLERFVVMFKPRKLNFETLVPKQLWEQHWRNHDKLHKLMREYQEVANLVRKAASTAIRV